MDEADYAQLQQEQFLEAAIRAARGVATSNAKSPNECVECGETLSEARKNAVPGVQLCVNCASELEQLRRMGGV